MRKEAKFIYSSEFEAFYNALRPADKAKLAWTIQQVKTLGMRIAIQQKWVKKLDQNLYEIRSRQSSNIQRAIYFQIVGNDYVITHGFTKKTQRTPQREINHAKRIRDEYLKQMKGQR